MSIELDQHCSDSDPEFAVICSFIKQFGDKIDLELNIEQLKSSIENDSNLDESLIDLHVKLLKKIRRYFVRDQWEKALIRFASEYSYEDAYEIESLGYLKTRPSIKLQLLRRLLDAQFECDQKFKASVNLCDANELRLQPIGRDIRGNTYWHKADKDGNLRIFQEQPLDYKSWKAVCVNNDDLKNLIDQLDECKGEKIKGEPIHEAYNPLPSVFPEYFIKKEESEVVSEDVKQVSKTKKGRAKFRGKKQSSPLPILNETAEEEIINDESSVIRSTNIVSPKMEDQATVDDRQSLAKSPTFLSSGSVESQVKQIVESLISKVISSFGNLVRPLSRNSTPDQKVEEIKEETKSRKKQAAKKPKQREEVLPRRSSSRIQQLHLKKIAEQQEEMKKIIESSAIKKSNFAASSLDDDSRSRSISSRNNRLGSESPDEGSKNGRKRSRGKRSWKRGKGKKKLSWDQDDSDLSSPSSLTESNDDEFDDTDGAFKFDTINYDDEFACEEEETNTEPVIIKRARTARQSLGIDEQNDLNSRLILEEDKPCERCDKSNDPEWILLCDKCDDGYHTSCCLPPLMIVPDGDWFCPPCEHKSLLTNLRELHTSMSEILEAKEREQKKKEKLRQITVKKEPTIKAVKVAKVPKISDSIPCIPEILPEKRRRCVPITLSEPVALQVIDEVIGSDDSDVETTNATSDESFQASSATEAEDDEEDLSEDDDDTEADTYYGSESSIDELVSVKQTRSKKKKKPRRENYDSDGSDVQQTRSRRAAAMRVSYKESTEDEDTDDYAENSKKSKKNTLSSEDESQVSWKSSAKSIVEDDRSTSCADSPPSIPTEEPTLKQEPTDCKVPDEVVEKRASSQATHNSHNSPDRYELPQQANSSIKRAKLEEKQECHVSTIAMNNNNTSLNESFDEIAGPLFIQRADRIQPVSVPMIIDKTQQSSHINMVPVGKVRDPIQELNQYCSESANSATMFNSYHGTLSSKNSSASIVHPSFYDDEEVKPSSSNEKQRKSKKTKAAADRNIEAVTCDTSTKIPIAALEKQRVAPAIPVINQERMTIPQQQPNPSPRQPIRPLMPTAMQFQHPPRPTQVYSTHQAPNTYSRSPFVSKYNQQPPPPVSSQLNNYPQAYENPNNNLIQQHRPTIPINPYTNSQIQTGIWNPTPAFGTPPTRQAIPPAYYSSAGPMSNPSFSFHQLLGNPYSMTGLAPPPNMPNLSQPSPSVQSFTSSQLTPVSTQSTNSDSSADARAADKDVIRGMSDVISFIGDT